MPEPTVRKMIFTDTETTGLDRDQHQVVELAWAVDDEPTTCVVLPHTLAHAEPRALEINRYYERKLDDEERWDADAVDEFMRDAGGNVLVGANIAFDADRLAKRAGFSTWHYRMLDIESAAMLLLGFPEPPGLRQIKERLTELGFELPHPDHSAAADVETTRAVLRHLQAIATYLLRAGVPTAKQVTELV